MKKIITILSLLCICMFAKAQTFKVIQKDGTVDEYDVENVDSVVFAMKKSVDSTPHFYYGVGTKPPSIEADFTNSSSDYAKTYATVTMESGGSADTEHYFNSGNAIDCDDYYCIWVAMPTGWSLSGKEASWTDEGGKGDEMKDDFVQVSDLSNEYGMKCTTIGTYTVYTIRLEFKLSNSYVIKATQ